MGCVAPEAPVASRGPLEAFGDLWVGGFDGTDGAYLRLDFAGDVARASADERRAPLGIIRPRLQHEEASFTIDDGKHRRSFVLHRAGARALEGTARDESGASSRVHLVQLTTSARAAVDAAIGGTYAVAGDPHHLLFVNDGRLFDTRDGTDRRLYLLAQDHVLVGSGVETAAPSFGIATRDAAGGLRIDRPGAEPLSSTRAEPAREEIRFASGDVMLQGVLLSPTTAGPHPAVVYVHGSGHATRKDPWENALARVWIAQGYSVFLYDKRGVGESGGEYVGVGGRDTNNVSAENLERLAGDARAALSVLANRKDIEVARLGLFGLSQAGWIIPLAAKGNRDVHFVVVMSGPAVPTSVQLAYQSLIGPGESCLSIPDADRLVHDHAPRTGLDPLPAIDALGIPGLWLYGGADVLVPFQESMRALEPLKQHHDFSIQLVPGAGHELYAVKRDDEEGRAVSAGFSPVALEALRSWLGRR